MQLRAEQLEASLARSLAPVTTNALLLVPVPPGVVTRMGPVGAVGGTTVVSTVFDRTVNVAGTPPNVTWLAPRKLVPSTVTKVPAGPSTGVNPVMLGGMRKLFVDRMTPPGVVISMAPELADRGTVAVIRFDAVTSNPAGTPLKVTRVVPGKLVPDSTTSVPTGPLVGVNDVSRGGR